MEVGTVRQIPIHEEMQDAYLTYAMSVIVARALPDVRDGLKPVHRRILYAMHDMGLTPARSYKKSARIVGEVLGKYHPHGDSAVYDAMVRMAQDFSLRYPLVDGQGNFGSVDGDSAAAMRYTEARLSPVAVEILRDIGEDTVDFLPNFDGTLQEPAVLPAAFPNLLVNGASGIAVGMSTNIPPHNLGEVVDALVHLIDNWAHLDDITASDLMKIIPGPDFPTGGVLYRYREERGEEIDCIARCYATGKGHFVVQARVHLEAMGRGRQRIVVTEIPYQITKSRIIERIADLVRSGRLEGISDVRDESDRTGMRLVIELQRNVEARDILPLLYRLTPMQQTFGAKMLALVDGEPRVLPLKRLLLLFLEHRQEVIRRRSQFRLEKARHRAHILEGLLKALDDLDTVVQIIRRSRTVDTARRNLMKRLQVTEIQAQAILDMPLKRLAALERKALEDEYKEKRRQIAFLEDLLAHPEKVLGVIREEFLDIKAKFADQRRTQIVDRTGAALTARDYLPDVPVAVVVSRSGDIWMQALETRRRGTAPGRGRRAPLALASGTTQHALYLVTNTGWIGRMPLHQVPQEPTPWRSLIDIPGEIAEVLVVRDGDEAGVLTLVTAAGRVKRVAFPEVARAAHKPVVCMAVDTGDQLVSAWYSQTSGDIMLFTRQGHVIRFADEDVRVMGLAAAGVLGMKLAQGDVVVGAGRAAGSEEVVAITTAGCGKRMALKDFPRQKRYGSGVVLLRLGRTSGLVADAALVGGKEEIFVVTRKGNVHYLRLEEIPKGKRGTAARSVLSLKEADEVERVLVLAPVATSRARRGALRRQAAPEPAPKPSPSRSRRPRTAAKKAAKKEPAQAQLPEAPQPPEPPRPPKKRTKKSTAPSIQPGEAATVIKKKSRKGSSKKTRRSPKKGIPRSVK